MKKQFAPYLLISVLLFMCNKNRSFSQTTQSLQISPELQENSDRWGISTTGRKNNIRLATFGPYSVTGLQKLDSGTSKNKIKEENGLSYKVTRIEKNTVFRMTMICESDSSETLFSVFSETREQDETLLGVLFKNGSYTGSETLSGRKQAKGIISIKNDSSHWRFFIDYPYTKADKSFIDEGVTGYLTNGVDSFTMKILLVSYRARGVSLMNIHDEQIAALVFKTSTILLTGNSENFTNDELVMINKNANRPARLAIGSLYAIMIGLQGHY